MKRTFAVLWQAVYPNGYWSLPNCISSNRYHFFPAPGMPTICGRWQSYQRNMQSTEVRNIVPHVDCVKCAQLLRDALAASDEKSAGPGPSLPDPALQRESVNPNATTMTTTPQLIADEGEKLTFNVLRKIAWKGKRYSADDTIEATEAETLVSPLAAWLEHGWVQREGEVAATVPAPAKPDGRKPAEIEFEVVETICRHGENLAPGARFSIKRTSSRVHVDRWIKEGRLRELPIEPERPTLEEALQLKIGDRLRGDAEGSNLWEVENWYPLAEEGPILRLREASKKVRGGLRGQLGIPVRNPVRQGQTIRGDLVRGEKGAFEIVGADVADPVEPRTSAVDDDGLRPWKVAPVPRDLLGSIAGKIECAKLSGMVKGAEKVPTVRSFEHEGTEYVAVSGASKGGDHGHIWVNACPVLRLAQVISPNPGQPRKRGRESHYAQRVMVRGKERALGIEDLHLVRSDCACEDCREAGGGERESALPSAVTPIPQTVSAETIQQILRAHIDRSRFNPRKDFTETPAAAASMAGLVESVRAQGIIVPLIVCPQEGKPGFYDLVAGERRWRAADRVGLETVPCIVRTLSKIKLLEQQALENIQRQNLNAIEEGQQYKTLKDEGGLSVPEIEKRTGKSEATIYSRLKLLECPPGIREAVISGRLKPSTADLVAREDDYDFQCAAMDAILFPEFGASEDEENSGAPVLSFRAAKAWLAANRDRFLAEAAWKKRQRDCPAHKDAGRILTVAESAEVLLSGGAVSKSQDYVKPDDPCFDDPERRTFAQLAAAAGVALPKPILAADPADQRPVVILPRGETETILAAVIPEAGAYKRRQAEQDAQREEERAEADRLRIARADSLKERARAAVGRFQAGFPAAMESVEPLWRFLVGTQLRALHEADAEEFVSAVREYGVPDLADEDESSVDVDWIDEYLAGCDVGKLRGWAVFLALRGGNAMDWYVNDVDEAQLLRVERFSIGAPAEVEEAKI